ncbi:exopolysaccharide biosynthesis WecB/TagA/CpsF family protein [Cellulomonas hominis]|nr:exopolysaccharide biosynthesis WecB/TagA/CpsF family protein [Cellulomonas hominis]
MTARTAWPRVLLGGTPVDLLDAPDAVATIVAHATSTEPWPLGVMSANLDHIHHFGCHGPSSLVPFTWAHPAAGEPPRARFRPEDAAAPAVRWLNLLDGAPLVRHAAHLTGRAWPRLAGSDLIDPILDAAEVQGLRVGFLGGRPEVLTALGERLAVDRPGLVVAGAWSPDRGDLDDAARSRDWADRVRAAGVEVLVVGLGKPRQERWILRYGPLTGARVQLAFGGPGPSSPSRRCEDRRMDLGDIEITTLRGERTTFGALTGGRVALVVNVASRCGLAPQYEQLEELQRTYGDRGFTVLGVPSNQFLQELGSSDAIAEYCSATWGVTFPMTEKVKVNGRGAHPLYRALTQVPDAGGKAGRVQWNFEKFLVHPDGSVRRFRPRTTPDAPEVVEAIEEYLGAGTRDA